MDIRPKSFIKRVFDFALAELDRRAQSAQPGASEPGLPQQRAELSATGSAELSPGVPHTTPEGALLTARAPEGALRAPHDEAAEAEPRHRTPAGGLEVARTERGAVRVRWAVGSSELERSSNLIDESAVLCLRLVSFAASRDHVVREVQDRPSI